MHSPVGGVGRSVAASIAGAVGLKTVRSVASLVVSAVGCVPVSVVVSSVVISWLVSVVAVAAVVVSVAIAVVAAGVVVGAVAGVVRAGVGRVAVVTVSVVVDGWDVGADDGGDGVGSVVVVGVPFNFGADLDGLNLGESKECKCEFHCDLD